MDMLTADGDAFHAQAPESWNQGRTVYGGLVAAWGAAAARRSVAELPPLRAAQICFMAPASGRLQFVPSLLRAGKSVSVVGVDCFSEGRLATRLTLTYGAERDSKITHDVTPPPHILGLDDALPFPLGRFVAPAYVHNFELRMAGGQALLSGSEHAAFDVWARHGEAEGTDPETALLALADCLPPAAMVQFEQVAPVSTITWGIDLFAPIEPAGWHLMCAHSEQAGGGYALEGMSIWNEHGQRVAVARQVVALFA
jgi:acyl-CoA thioesterase